MFVVKRLNNMSKIRKRGIDMTREEKEDRKLELFDNILFGEKMIARGEATREELQSQFDEIEKELKKIKLKANNIIESEVNIYGKFCGSISFKN